MNKNNYTLVTVSMKETNKKRIRIQETCYDTGQSGWTLRKRNLSRNRIMIKKKLCDSLQRNTIPGKGISMSQVELVVKNHPAKAEDPGLIPGSGRSSGGGHSNPQYSCLENPELYPEFSILLPNPEEIGRLQSIGSQSVSHN